jgi:predicted HTH transcriptional regulator
MLKKTINTPKLKVKYVLGNHSTIPGYPDAEDVLFELIRDYCGKVAKELKFTNVSLQKRYELTEEKTSAIIERLMADGILREIHSNSAYKTYEVIINPYV